MENRIKEVGSQEKVKKCSKCGEVKQLEMFGKDKREKYGVSYQCSECRRKYDYENRKIEKEFILTGMKRENNYKKVIVRGDLRVCRRCGDEKPIANFYKKYKEVVTTGWICKKCNSIREREGIRNNESQRQLERERSKRYRENNKEKRSQQNKKWRENSLERVHKREKERREVYNQDSHYRIKVKLRKHAGRYIKREDKREPTMKMLGCSVEFLMEHLQKTAIKNGYLNFDIMNYDTKEFVIDHIVPLDVWNLVCGYHQKLACNWENLQILDSSTNQSKGSKLDYVVDVEANKKKHGIKQGV